jgi:hypothetical protein
MPAKAGIQTHSIILDSRYLFLAEPDFRRDTAGNEHQGQEGKKFSMYHGSSLLTRLARVPVVPNVVAALRRGLSGLFGEGPIADHGWFDPGLVFCSERPDGDPFLGYDIGHGQVGVILVAIYRVETLCGGAVEF